MTVKHSVIDTIRILRGRAPQVPFGVDPRHYHTETDPRIFVFGSNALGIHGGGAAWYAHKKLGAVWGMGEGPTGLTYAIPTCFEPGEAVDLGSLERAVLGFLEYARRNPGIRFFVSEVGCGIAGLYVHEVAPLFDPAPRNCDLPPGWDDGTWECQCPRHDGLAG